MGENPTGRHTQVSVVRQDHGLFFTVAMQLGRQSDLRSNLEGYRDSHRRIPNVNEVTAMIRGTQGQMRLWLLILEKKRSKPIAEKYRAGLRSG